MSIQRISRGHTQGFQVRIFRHSKLMTRFVAFAKHGGEDAARLLAEQTEKALKKKAGPPSKARRLGGHAKKPNRNSTSGVVGIRAHYSKRDHILQFTATWSEVKPSGDHVACTAQFSSAAYGILNALDKALRARESGSGNKMMSARSAWRIISKNLEKKNSA